MANFEKLVLGWLAGWLAGKPDYPQKLKAPEGYEKINEKSNIGRGTVDGCTEAKFRKQMPNSKY